MKTFKDIDGTEIKLVVDLRETYKGFDIESLLAPNGTKILRLHFPKEYSDDFDTLFDDKAFNWFIRVCNCDNDICITTEENRKIITVFVGYNKDGLHPYIILPEVDRARELYGDQINPCIALSDDHIEHIMTKCGIIEYTPKTVINCGKRFIDLFLAKVNNIEIPIDDDAMIIEICSLRLTNDPTKLIPDKEITYKGHRIDTGVNETGDRFCRIYTIEEENKSLESDADTTTTEIIRLANTNVINLTKDFLYFMVGCNLVVKNAPKSVPDAELAKRVYGDMLPEHLKDYPELNYNRSIQSFHTIEYTAETALNCARRIIDRIFPSINNQGDDKQ